MIVRFCKEHVAASYKPVAKYRITLYSVHTTIALRVGLTLKSAIK